MDNTPTPVTGGLRPALLLLLAGSVLILSTTLAFPVVGDFWDDQNDAAQIAVIDADRTQFAIAFGLQGLGSIVIGAGLFLLSRTVAGMEAPSGRRRTAALAAGWLGLLVAVGGLSQLLHAALATPEFYVDSAVADVVVIIAGLALLLSMVTLGVLAWSAPPPRWLAVVLVVGGLLNIVPDLAYAALTVFSIGMLIVLRRPAHAVSPSTVTNPERTTST